MLISQSHMFGSHGKVEGRGLPVQEEMSHRAQRMGTQAAGSQGTLG